MRQKSGEKFALNRVDNTGRLYPKPWMNGVTSPSWRHRFVQPEFSYDQVHARIAKYFPKAPLVSKEEFEARATALMDEVGKDATRRNLLNGVHLPIVLPQLPEGDYGELFEKIYIRAVRRSHLNRSRSHTFHNARKGDLARMVCPVEPRHFALVDLMREGPVVGVYFANPLQGFGIEAADRMIKELPQGYSLSGGFDAAVAYAAYPDTLASGTGSVSTVCAALNFARGRTLVFHTVDRNLRFDMWDLEPIDYVSPGLLYIG